MFRQLFEEGLELQKVRLREQRAHAKMQRLEHQRQHQDQITSMENYYKDQVGHTVTHTVTYIRLKSHTVLMDVYFHLKHSVLHVFHHLLIHAFSLLVFPASGKTCTRETGDPGSEKSPRKGKAFSSSFLSSSLKALFVVLRHPLINYTMHFLWNPG